MEKNQAEIFRKPSNIYGLGTFKGYEQKKCIHCGSPITKKNGMVNGRQLYKCHACGNGRHNYIDKRRRLMFTFS